MRVVPRVACLANAFVVVVLLLCGVGGCGTGREPWEAIPIRPGAIEKTSLPDASGLSVTRIRFYSRSSGEPRFLIVLSPKFAPAPPRGVLILDHGFWDRPEDLIKSLKVDRVYADLLAAGRVRPALIVLPDVRFSTYFVGNVQRYPFPTYLPLLSDEVAGIVSTLYDEPLDREQWGIGGFSFGGYMALDVGRRYPGRFGRVSVVSSFFDANWTFWPSKPVPSEEVDTQGRGKQTIVTPGPVPRVFLACGDEDRFIEEMRRLHGLLETRGIPHTWVTAEGAHTWEYWSSVVGPMLAFHLSPENGGAGAAGH